MIDHVTTHEGRTFDYVPRLHEANRAYRVTTTDPALAGRSRFWVPGPVLDQGREGACVGFGCTAEAIASPVRVKPNGWASPGTITEQANGIARDVYRAAQRIDEWEGENYEGTSVRAGMLVGRNMGWWGGFRWAFNMTELRAALEFGPVVIGVDWRAGMYDAPEGVLTPTGPVVGGHAILITGYTRHHRGIKAPAYRLRNSWGRHWGLNGTAYISVPDLDSILFRAGGEAAVPMLRQG